ncbi:replication protein A 70 kDa DNA-binding subunit isoform X2 [Stigmatopora nigra]
MITLSEGAIQVLASGNAFNDAVLQLVSIRKIEGGNGPPRFRLMMSDGRHTMSSFMLCTQLNCMAEDNRLAVNCVILLKRHVTNLLKDGRPVVVILELDVVKRAEEVKEKIGNPTPYTDGTNKGPQQNSASSTPAVPANRASLQAQTTNDSSSSLLPVNRTITKDFGKKPAMAPLPGGPTKVGPIASLNPYVSKWTIRARVTNKSSIRTWSNARGEGKLFSMEIVDESGEIRVTAFNQEVDKYFELIEVGKVYYINKGNVKMANKQYTAVKNDYEVTLSGDTSIILCDDSDEVPKMQCEFISIGDLEKKNKDDCADIIGVCKSANELSRITTRASREVSKRTITLMDMSGKMVSLTLWGEEAEQFDPASQPVVAIKGAKVSDFGGRSLSASFSSTLMINPDIPQAYKLRGWYDKEGHNMEGESLTELRSGGGVGNTNWKTLSEVKTEQLGHGEKADYYNCIGTIVYIRKENSLYQACANQDCNKKVIDQQNGMFRCEKCDKEFPNFKYRLILSVNISDHSDNQWVTCFQESAETILGQNAAYLGQLKESNETAFDAIFLQATFKTLVFRNRVKLETYNDESRIKATVMEVKPVDHREYCQKLIMNIKKMSAK